jgi:hypothetical protein
MKVSGSIRPEYVLAAAYLAAHLPSLASSLEDIDSLNFALGLRHFDPALHQPHPPGYPVYIALGRLSLSVVSRIAPGLDRLGGEAVALAIWSALGGAIAIIAAAALFRRLGDGRVAAWAAGLMAACPLFWLSGLRPMSDMPGLAVTLVAMAFLARGIDERRWLAAGALIAGLAIGLRSQAMWLTLPLLALALIFQRKAGAWWLLSRPIAALAAGGIAWGVPLLAASGGVSGYLRALAMQADLDFAGVEMLWLNPTPHKLAITLYETLVMPWAAIPLAAIVLVAAALGAVLMLARQHRALLVLLVAFLPYAAFHLLFQETVFVRYALPLVPPVAWLAVRGVAAAGGRLPLVAVPLVGAALYVAVPGGLLYGEQIHPAFRAIGDASRRAQVAPPAATHVHFSLWRPLQTADSAALHPVAPQRQREWLALVTYWRSGGRCAALVHGRSAAHRSGADRSAIAPRRGALRLAARESAGTERHAAGRSRLVPPPATRLVRR